MTDWLQHRERHAAIGTAGWGRRCGGGAADGIVSVAGLVIGVAAAGSSTAVILAAGVAGVASGALSMAAGEYVSVAAQRDTEHADIALETRELHEQPEAELAELVAIYVERGLSSSLATEVAVALTKLDALGTHLREELAIDLRSVARPWQAAWLSAVSFTIGAAIPVLTMYLVGHSLRVPVTVAVTLVVLAAAGAIAARLGRSRLVAGILRVSAGGAIAMGATWLIGRAFHVG
jgi:VIT1/CCC1 family predicted Fe2+/Mn2+ transporter